MSNGVPVALLALVVIGVGAAFLVRNIVYRRNGRVPADHRLFGPLVPGISPFWLQSSIAGVWVVAGIVLFVASFRIA